MNFLIIYGDFSCLCLFTKVQKFGLKLIWPGLDSVVVWHFRNSTLLGTTTPRAACALWIGSNWRRRSGAHSMIHHDLNGCDEGTEDWTTKLVVFSKKFGDLRCFFSKPTGKLWHCRCSAVSGNTKMAVGRLRKSDGLPVNNARDKRL